MAVGIPRKGIGGIVDNVKDSINEILKRKPKQPPTTTGPVPQMDTKGNVVKDSSGNVVPNKVYYSGGGGSSRSRSSGSSSNNNAAQQEQARQQAEQKALADKQFAQAEAQRQAIQQNREFIKYQTSQAQPTIPVGALKETKTATGTLNKPTTGYSTSYEKRVGDKPLTTYTPRFGTQTYDGMGRTTGSFIKDTRTAIQRDYDRQIASGISPELAGKSPELQLNVVSANEELAITRKYQGKVSSGELSVEEAQSMAEIEYNDTMAKNINRININAGDPKLYQTVAAKRKETAINLGKGIASTNILGATILGAEALEKNAVVVLEKDGSIPLYPTLKQSSPEAALYFGAAAIEGIGLPFKYAKQYDKATLEALKIKPVKFVGTEKVLSDKSIVNLMGKRQVFGAKETISAEIPGFTLKDPTKFSIQGGKATSVVELDPFLSRVRNIKNPTVISSESVKLFGRGETLGTQLRINENLIKIPQKTTKGEFGIIRGGPQIDSIKFGKDITIKGKIVPETVTTGKFGGLANKKGDISFIAGGKAKSLKIYPGQRASIKYDLGQYGFLKRINAEDIGSTFKSSTSTAVKPSAIDKQLQTTASKVFDNKPTQLGESLGIFGQATTKELTTVAPTKSFSLKPVVLSSQPKQSKYTPQRQVNIQLNTPITTSATRSLIIPLSKTTTSTKQRSQQRSIQALDFAQVTKTKQDTKVGQLQASKQVMKQQQALRSPTVFAPGFGNPRIGYGVPKISGTPLTIKMPKIKGYAKPKSLYGVQVRRQGQWLNVGSARDFNKALNLGKYTTRNTLARSIRITGNGVPRMPKVPQGFYVSKTLGKNVIVQTSKTSLSSGGEKSEIRAFQNIKRKKKSSGRASQRPVSRRKKKKNLSFTDFI